MNRKLLFILVIFTGILFYSCEDKATDPIDPNAEKGNIFLQSTPTGAEIWVKGVNSGKVTPDTIKNQDSGNVQVTLKRAGYDDTTFTVLVLPKQTRSIAVILTESIDAVLIGPVRIWETTGTTAAQPSGLVLSSGSAYGIGTTSANRDSVDIYYSSNGFKIRSAHLTTLPKTTHLKDGNATNLKDGVQSPLQDGTWVFEMADNAPNYFFMKDATGRYAKVKVTANGGGTPGNPAYLELTWYYNKKVGDRRFPK